MIDLICFMKLIVLQVFKAMTDYNVNLQFVPVLKQDSLRGKRFRASSSRKFRREQKKRNEGGGEGRGEKELPFVHFVLCSKQGNEIEGFFLNRVCMSGRILGHFGPKQGQGLKPGPAAQSYPNIGLVPPSPSQLGLQLPGYNSTVFGFCLEVVLKTRCLEGSVSCYKQKQPHITIHEVPATQNGRRVRFPTEKVTQKRNVSHNVLFRAGVCLYSRCGQSYFNIK